MVEEYKQCHAITKSCAKFMNFESSRSNEDKYILPS